VTEAADQYAVQQAALRNRAGETPRDDEINIAVPKPVAAEINPELFKDVEPLLLRGFLYASAVINGVLFVFKSLNHHEFERLGFHSGTQGSGHAVNTRQYDLFLAYGVYMVDGVNVLSDRDEWLPELSAFFHDLTDIARRKVIFELSEINRRAAQAVILTEPYSMEIVSRLRWAQVRGLDLTSVGVSGIEGSQHLGMNWAQLTWRSLNYFEDQRDIAEREWENAKFVASSMAGKGMSKIHAQDKRRREEETNTKFERRDKIIRLALLGDTGDQDDAQGPTMQVARTVEELAVQLEHDLKGERDWHDDVVAAHESRVLADRTAKMDRLRQLQSDYEEKYGDSPVIGGTEMTGLSPAEVNERITRRRQLMAQRLAARQVVPAFQELQDPRMGQFMDKWHGTGGDQKDLGVRVADRPRGLSIPRNGES